MSMSDMSTTTPLPVLHLKPTSLYNMTITDDPYETTVTLYTFLRSIPTAAEKELALQPFLDALHTAPSSGRGLVLRKPNHRLVQLLEAVAVDGAFRATPHVLPALARHSDRWMRRLGYAEAEAAQTPRQHESHEPSLSTSSPPHDVVHAGDMHQYYDPYTAYEAEYAAAHATTAPASPLSMPSSHGVDSPRQRAEEAGEHLQYSGSTQPPDEPGEGEECSSSQQQQQQQSYLSAEVSALTAPDSGSRGVSHEFQPGFLLPDDAGAAPSGTVHPVLELIAGQVSHAVADAPQDAGRPSVDRLLEQHLHSVAAELADAEAQLDAVMREQEEAEQVWSPEYSRLKTSKAYVAELQDRVACAHSLFQLQQYERETLQQAHIAVAMEAMSLKLVLRDVRARVEDAEQQPGGRQQFSPDDEDLLQQLRAVLLQQPPPPSTVSGDRG